MVLAVFVAALLGRAAGVALTSFSWRRRQAEWHYQLAAEQDKAAETLEAERHTSLQAQAEQRALFESMAERAGLGPNGAHQHGEQIIPGAVSCRGRNSGQDYPGGRPHPAPGGNRRETGRQRGAAQPGTGAARLAASVPGNQCQRGVGSARSLPGRYFRVPRHHSGQALGKHPA